MPVRSSKTSNRSVLMVGSEALPFAKTGGLADVLGALPLALARQGWKVTLVLPKYRGVDVGQPAGRLSLAVGGRPIEVGFVKAAFGEDATAILIDAPELYDREGIYGIGTEDYADSPRRFAVLARAALEFAAQDERVPSVVHAHDWQAGLVPVYLRTLYAAHPRLMRLPVVFTIHNLAYQGVFDRDWVPRIDLPWTVWTPERLEYWGRMSLLKGGINDADAITTVSPTYAREIQTPEFGCGFDGILRQRAGDLTGVLNGIDQHVWNPARDPALPASYDAVHLERKALSKREVLVRYGLPSDDAGMQRPLIGMISRMVDQKGLDLIAQGWRELVKLDVAFVVLGTGEARYEELWRRLSREYPGRVAARIGFDETLAHLIEAGADMFLMPSHFEPCGLNQMYSLRYGTVPIVRSVGGLADTIEEGRNGFVFQDYSAPALLEAVKRALAAYGNVASWRELQRAGMQEDHSWDRSASEYVTIYETLLQRGPRG